MKKTYISPTATIVKIQITSHLLSDSENLGLGTSGSANEAEARRGDFFWDDEDEVLSEIPTYNIWEE